MPQTDGSAKQAHDVPSRWSRPLARPVALRDGANLVTLADVRSFLFKRMKSHHKETPNWQRVTALLLSAARSDAVDIAEVTIAVEMAAKMEETPPGLRTR